MVCQSRWEGPCQGAHPEGAEGHLEEGRDGAVVESEEAPGMMTCLLCRQERDALTDEHILPMALGGNLYLPRSTCEACQQLCNRSFEQKFLKGTNYIAMLRATLGLRGRGEEPIYGFDNHGEPLTVIVQSGFPPLRVGF